MRCWSNLVANARLLLVAAVGVRLDLKRLANATVALTGRVGTHDPAARC